MSSTRTLILVRHGETTWNKEGRFQGQSDVPLSDVGRAQIRALRGRLESTARHAHLFDHSQTAVLTSDLSRAYETAEIAFGIPGRTLHATAGLREFRYGVFEGLTRDEIEARYPGAMGEWIRSDRAYAMRGGESRDHVRARAVAAVTEFLSGAPQRHVVVVAHGGVMRQLLHACFGEAGEPWAISYANGVAHVVDVDGVAWTYAGELR